MEEEGTRMLVMRCINLVSSEHRTRNFIQKGGMCCQTEGMVGLGDEPRWKEAGLKLRQCFRESEAKAYGREGGFCTLWQTEFPLQVYPEG